jgi:hypothetical protein
LFVVVVHCFFASLSIFTQKDILYKQMLNKYERAIINRESTDTGNIGLKTKNEDKRNKKQNTENL